TPFLRKPLISSPNQSCRDRQHSLLIPRSQVRSLPGPTSEKPANACFPSEALQAFRENWALGGNRRSNKRTGGGTSRWISISLESRSRHFAATSLWLGALYLLTRHPFVVATGLGNRERSTRFHRSSIARPW